MLRAGTLQRFRPGFEGAFPQSWIGLGFDAMRAWAGGRRGGACRHIRDWSECLFRDLRDIGAGAARCVGRLGGVAGIRGLVLPWLARGRRVARLAAITGGGRRRRRSGRAGGRLVGGRGLARLDEETVRRLAGGLGLVEVQLGDGAERGHGEGGVLLALVLGALLSDAVEGGEEGLGVGVLVPGDNLGEGDAAHLGDLREGGTAGEIVAEEVVAQGEIGS